MKLQKCKNGHFYDTDKYTQCPHCEKSAGGMQDMVTEALNPADPIHTEMLTEAPVQQPQPEKEPVYQKAPVFEVKSEENHTVGYYSRVIGTEPVVGWLVCTEGEYFGESFKLKSGRNFIGRSSGMDVVLSADMSVSRSKHAIIVYEPRKRMFIAQPGESRELFYLNDDVVLSNVEMQAYDVITIGTTKLMLIPCCGERFSWDDVKKES
ncbi:FHA domain-containing protein [Faecalicatena contorta]|uniref:FHA domain-containing protein n=1 Tax=Faecalicatena contorta TaxID=39482 RepID=UPI001F2AF6BD|nr:FHA domain-containing protein [Faecalicatena contorta]MCF2683523.1 FHA domain-containing protein [Faecalicatena contorta]